MKLDPEIFTRDAFYMSQRLQVSGLKSNLIGVFPLGAIMSSSYGNPEDSNLRF